uniref:Variable large protein n=1 Tax=Rhabditophanes sp. KR3021 TaxID=114890 RepID=A0AC35U3G9_9BILA
MAGLWGETKQGANVIMDKAAPKLMDVAQATKEVGKDVVRATKNAGGLSKNSLNSIVGKCNQRKIGHENETEEQKALRRKRGMKEILCQQRGRI